MLKLFRLARLPRLVKLLNPQKFKRLLSSLDGPNPSSDLIIQRGRNMFIYNIFNLILMMIFLVYGIGCMFYLVSHYISLSSDNAFAAYFSLEEKS